jgi:nitrite reductase/ring-hydroxylating ferredoxin subunit
VFFAVRDLAEGGLKATGLQTFKRGFGVNFAYGGVCHHRACAAKSGFLQKFTRIR